MNKDSIDTSVVDAMDSVHISLLTCSPHQEVYSLYGHSALRVQDDRRGMDIAINYGMFSFGKPFFVLRFVFGLTDYEMGIVPFDMFLREYNYYQSSVQQQEFNLTAEEKRKVLAAIEENYRPENRVYRYNYFYDNCTTRARDIVVNNLSGNVVYDCSVPEGITFRQMIHEMNEGHPWARLGNDLLLGVGADRPLEMEQYQFLPHSMLTSADSAYIVDAKGNKRPLVLSTVEVLQAGSQIVEPEFPLTPVQCALLLLSVTIVVTLVEYKRRRYYWWYDAIIMALQGLCGIVLTAMIFSQHPTVSLNIQILILSPLPLFLGYKAIHHELQRNKSGVENARCHWYWTLATVLVCLALVLNTFDVQWLDTSVKIVALCLLLRCCIKQCKPKNANRSVC